MTQGHFSRIKPFALAAMVAAGFGMFAPKAQAFNLFLIDTDGDMVGDTGSKWEPNVNTAALFPGATPPGTPGGATWSIIAPGVFTSFGDSVSMGGFHPDNSTSTAVDQLFPALTLATFEQMVDDALDAWAAVSGFTNLGQVADGGSFSGDPGGNFPNVDGETGDIRVGAFPTVLGPNNSLTLAHASLPGTTALIPDINNSGGDVHINNWALQNNPQVTWIDDPNHVLPVNGIQYDLFTTVLHEVGHALGLGHTDVAGSVMQQYADRRTAQQVLQADDIAGIQAIYGPAIVGPGPGPGPGGNGAVPEPVTGVLSMLGLGALGAATRRRVA